MYQRSFQLPQVKRVPLFDAAATRPTRQLITGRLSGVTVSAGAETPDTERVTVTGDSFCTGGGDWGWVGGSEHDNRPASGSR